MLRYHSHFDDYNCYLFSGYCIIHSALNQFICLELGMQGAFLSRECCNRSADNTDRIINSVFHLKSADKTDRIINSVRYHPNRSYTSKTVQHHRVQKSGFTVPKSAAEFHRSDFISVDKSMVQVATCKVRKQIQQFWSSTVPFPEAINFNFLHAWILLAVRLRTSRSHPIYFLFHLPFLSTTQISFHQTFSTTSNLRISNDDSSWENRARRNHNQTNFVKPTISPSKLTSYT